MTIHWNDELDAALIELREQGLGYKAAGERLGISDDPVRDRCIALGLPTWGRGGGRKARGPRAVRNAIKNKN